jgi:aspartate/glutamate racemase
VLCTNTMHKLADYITEAIDVPFVHIADSRCATSSRSAPLRPFRPAVSAQRRPLIR